MLINNPYLEKYKEWDKAHSFKNGSWWSRDYDRCGHQPHLKSYDRDCHEYNMRRRLVQEYAWAIPTEEAIAAILKYSPLVEVGAGTGYWASLIRQAGGDIIVSDKNPPQLEGNKYHSYGYQWIPGSEYIQADAIEVASAYPERTLFWCWPEYQGKYIAPALRAYKGQYFIYIGEGNGGCTGSEKFHNILEDEWEVVEEIDIPQWEGIHDYMTIYRRISNP